MEPNDQHPLQWELLLAELEGALAEIESDDLTAPAKARTCCHLCRDYLLKLQTIRDRYQSLQEEVSYFRDIKPKFYSRYIYYGELGQLLSGDLAISPEVQENYYRKHLGRIETFLEWYAPFYKYYKSGLDYLDDHYFTSQQHVDDYSLFFDIADLDPQQSTGFDYLLSKALAYEQLSIYINEHIRKIKEPASSALPAPGRSAALHWTAQKVALVELIYALYAAGVFNDATTDIKSIADAFSHLFAIPLKNIYKVWEEIRLRQRNRTMFIDALKTNLLRKMDEDDLAAK